MKLKTIFESLNLKEDSAKLTPGQIIVNILLTIFFYIN